MLNVETGVGGAGLRLSLGRLNIASVSLKLVGMIRRIAKRSAVKVGVGTEVGIEAGLVAGPGIRKAAGADARWYFPLFDRGLICLLWHC